jgi:hypothetical protein
MEYWLVMTGDQSEQGLNGEIDRRSELRDKIVNDMGIKLVDEYVKKVENLGGTVIRP